MIHLRPASPYPQRQVMAHALVEEVKVLSLRDVLAIRARRAPGPRTESCYLRVEQRTPRTGRRRPRHPCRRMRRGLLRSCAMNIAAMLVVPSVLMERLLSITLVMRGTSMHAKTLEEAAHSRGTMMELLLTWLGVRAPHVPRTFRRHLHQQKHWHEHSCS